MTLVYLIRIIEWLSLAPKVVRDLHRPRAFAIDSKGKSMLNPTAEALATPFVLILVPTRELAIQIFNELVDLTQGARVSPGVLYSGTDRKNHASTLRKGCNVLCATPGQLTNVC